MGIDVDTLSKSVALFGAAITAIKQAIDLLPESPKKADAEAALRQAERGLKIAEAQTAKGLGYELCRRHHPPEIMLSQDEYDQIWKCPVCGNKKDLTPKVYGGAVF